MKWIRDLDGNIGKRVGDHLAKKQNGETFPLYLNGMYKVKDTVQELIEVGDELFLKDRYGMGNGIFKITITKVEQENGITYVTYNDIYIQKPRRLQINETMKIIKILTPNGKDYICQWEAE